MSSVTTYKCDRCSKESTDREALDLHCVMVGSLEAYRVQYDRVVKLLDFADRKVEWCAACRVEMGLAHPSHDKDTTPQDPPPSLEDMIREIAREEADAVLEEGR